MIKGGCLCGGIRFEIDRVTGPFELCHCRRCRKASGSAFAATVGVQAGDFRLIQGTNLITTYDAPLLERPPAHRTSFCRRCGSPVPSPDPNATWFEVTAGSLEGDLGLRPERHIFVEFSAAWFEIADHLPRLDKQAVAALRQPESEGSRPE